MSVLLTSVKSKPKPKHHATTKVQRQDSGSSTSSNGGGAPLPPLSNENTAVWTWDEDGATTTIMLTRDSMQLWCNGVVVEADELVSDGDYEFEIYHKHTDKSSSARIMAVPDMHGVMTYNLYVDGNFIAEHTAGNHLRQSF